jgi:hypothetical protein
VEIASLVVTKERIRQRISSGKVLILSTTDAAAADLEFLRRGGIFRL